MKKRQNFHVFVVVVEVFFFVFILCFAKRVMCVRHFVIYDAADESRKTILTHTSLHM